MLLDCGKLPHWRFAEDLAGAVGAPHRLSRLDQPQAREARNDRPARARVERFRPSHAGDQAAAQHQAADAAVEDRAFRSTSPSASARASSTSRCRSCACVAPRYTRHPDRNQEAYFYALLAEALDCGSVTRRAGREGTSVSAMSGRIRPSLSSAIAAICGRRSRLLQKPPDALGDQLGIIGRIARLGRVDRSRQSHAPRAPPRRNAGRADEAACPAGGGPSPP